MAKFTVTTDNGDQSKAREFENYIAARAAYTAAARDVRDGICFSAALDSHRADGTTARLHYAELKG